MTARHVYALTCDVEGCPEKFPTDKITAIEARREAEPIGWAHQLVKRAHGPAKSIDLCPKHGKPNA